MLQGVGHGASGLVGSADCNDLGSWDPDQSLDSKVWKQLLACDCASKPTFSWACWPNVEASLHPFRKAKRDSEPLQNLTTEVSQSKCHFGQTVSSVWEADSMFHSLHQSPKPEPSVLNGKPCAANPVTR